MDQIKEKLKLLPLLPGCYLMKDNTGKVIYVGKAKKLKNRVTSYFVGTKTGKTKVLVDNICDFEYIVTETEKEALLLEINLIKKYDPKYNIIFRDDKTYPYIMLTLGDSPTLTVTRSTKIKGKKNIKLFGPYPNSFAAKKIVYLLNRLYPLRKCKNFKDKPCLYYHIGECLGYCHLDIDKEKKDEMVNEIISFLNGNSDIIKKLKEEMKIESEKLNFERAKELKDLIGSISIILEKQKIDLNDNVNRDIFNYYIYEDYISIQVLHLRNGNLVERNSYIYENFSNEADIMNDFIISFYESNEKPKEIFVPDNLSIDLINDILDIKVLSPVKGSKKKLLDMAKTNAKIKLLDDIKLYNNKKEKEEGANEELSKLLNINIHRIESFDNSHLFGSYIVSGMVVYIDGKKSKKDYRKYKIDSSIKDDYHQMMAVIERRYTRVINEDLIKPDLILADGGIIQINAIKEVLDNLCLDIPVYGMKKDNKHRICALIDENNNEIEIEKNSNIFHYLENISEEVHRFTISFHKDIRSKGFLESKLDNIPKIGKKRKELLLKEFKTIENIKNASDEELLKILPKDIVKILKDNL